MFKKKHQKPPERNALRTRQPTAERGPAASVFSYHANRTAARPGASRRQEPAEAPAERAKRNVRLAVLRRGRWIAALAIIAGALVVNLFLSRTPGTVFVSDAKGDVFLQDHSVYQEAATRALQASVLNTNKLTINTAAIENSLRSDFPELAAVRVSVPFAGSMVRIYMEPATAQLLLSAGPDVYVLDENGRAVMSAAEAKHVEKANLPVVTDESNLPIKSGYPALPSTSVAFITEVVEQLRAKQVPISSLTLPAGSSELDVRITGQPYFVKFNLQGNAREEAGTFLAVKAQLEREKKTPGTYIDVRVQERAYYK